MERDDALRMVLDDGFIDTIGTEEQLKSLVKRRINYTPSSNSNEKEIEESIISAITRAGIQFSEGGIRCDSFEWGTEQSRHFFKIKEGLPKLLFTVLRVVITSGSLIGDGLINGDAMSKDKIIEDVVEWISSFVDVIHRLREIHVLIPYDCFCVYKRCFFEWKAKKQIKRQDIIQAFCRENALCFMPPIYNDEITCEYLGAGECCKIVNDEDKIQKIIGKLISLGVMVEDSISKDLRIVI